MPGRLAKLLSAKFARATDTSASSKFFSPGRFIIVCAVTLAIITVGSAGLIVYNLRNRVVTENERALTNSALIIAKQIEQTFTAMEALQKEFSEEISRAPGISKKTLDSQTAATMFI